MSRPLPVYLAVDASRTQWWVYSSVTVDSIGKLSVSGRGRMIEAHKVGCHCEAPGVGP